MDHHDVRENNAPGTGYPMRASPSYNVVQLLKYSRFLHNMQLLDTKSDILKLYPLVIRRSRIDDRSSQRHRALVLILQNLNAKLRSNSFFGYNNLSHFVDCQDAIPALKYTNGDKEPACER